MKIIGLTYDLKSDWPAGPDDPIDANAEFDTEKTIGDIAAALESGGHRVVKIGHVRNLLKKIEDLVLELKLKDRV